VAVLVLRSLFKNYCKSINKKYRNEIVFTEEGKHNLNNVARSFAITTPEA